MIFDSNIRINTGNYHSFLKKLKFKIKVYGIKNAICILCSKDKKYNIPGFLKALEKNQEFIPAIELKKKVSLKFLKDLKKKKIKIIKIHPRHINMPFHKKVYYLNLFKKISKFNFTIMWCTLDSWKNKIPDTDHQLNLITMMTNKCNKNKIILMHSGGTNLLKFYEKFRFKKNIYFDLSYTIDLYKKTTLENDIKFLFNKFDERIIVGTDYPDIKFKKHYCNLLELVKKSKITITKKKNILFNNLKKLTNEP